MLDNIPIAAIDGVELVPSGNPQIAHVRVLDRKASKHLPWDRFVRLQATADFVRSQKHLGMRLLDVGGYDGALALFLDDIEIDLLDPKTTGGSATAIQVSTDRVKVDQLFSTGLAGFTDQTRAIFFLISQSLT